MTVNVSKPVVNVREKLAELDKPTGIAGEAMLRAETPQEQFNLIGAGRRNLIINGAMRVAQRGTSTTSVTTPGYYACDRFQYSYGQRDDLTATISQSTDAPDGFSSSFKLQTTTPESDVASNEYFIVRHRIEAQDLQHLAYGTNNAKSLTLSFWIKSSLAATYAVYLYAPDAPRIIGSTYTINSANTWEYKTITFAGDIGGTINDDSGVGLDLSFVLGAGSSYTSTDNTSWGSYSGGKLGYGHTANAFVTTSSSTWQVTGVQLELGKVATPFEHRSYGEELALCQRYYQTHTVADPYHYIGGLMAALTTTGLVQTFRLSPPMRAAPSFTSTGFRWKRITGGLSNMTLSSVSVNDATTTDVDIRWFLSSTTTVGNVGYLESNGDSSAKLEFIAEL